MNKIEKLYKNAGIIRRRKCEFYEECPLLFSHSCDDCDIEYRESNSFYPPFTAEKQIRLVEILSKRTLKVFTNEQPFCVKVSVKDQKNDYFIGCEELNFGNALANLVSHLWQDLTEEEKQQLKEILE